MVSTRGKKLIGQGLFSKVYDNGDNTVTVVSSDSTKEALALFIEGDRFPQIERVDYDQKSTYIMPKYEKTKGIKNKVSAREWGLYTWLRDVLFEVSYNIRRDHKSRFNTLCEVLERMPSEYANERDQLLDAMSALSNYGTDIAFEIMPRNVFIEKGKIIFADCFFFISEMQRA